jgi:hypothetical protein
MATTYFGVTPGGSVSQTVTVDTSTTGADVELAFTYASTPDSLALMLLQQAVEAIRQRIQERGIEPT